MEKPRKKEYREGEKPYPLSDFCINKGFNQAIDDYEKFLPSYDEILEMLNKVPKDSYSYDKSLAKAIAKRIGK